MQHGRLYEVVRLFGTHGSHMKGHVYTQVCKHNKVAYQAEAMVTGCAAEDATL